MTGMTEIKQSCVNTIREECQDKTCAVVGISGGVNSAVTAALCVEALGQDRVFGILMPNCVQKNLDLAMLTVTSLGIAHEIINIMEVMKGYRLALPFQQSDYTCRELSHQVRLSVLKAVGEQRHGCVVRPDLLGVSSDVMPLLGTSCGLPDLLLHTRREKY